MRYWAAFFGLMLISCPLFAEEAAQNPAGKPDQKAPAVEKKAEKPELPFQIQLLETHIRFEVNGDSRKEVHTIVKINNILGARQFARLGFDYNRGFQQIEIPLVRISHANGGTSEVLPSAVTDAPNPAVEKYPAYQDVRVKSVRILGLQEGDTVEYRVVTTTTHHPLAPDFWLEHSFDRSGQVLEEHYELDLPASREVKVWTSEYSQSFEEAKSGEGVTMRVLYRWKYLAGSASPKHADRVPADLPAYLADADVALTTYTEWPKLMLAVHKFFPYMRPAAPEIKNEAVKLTTEAKIPEERLRLLYDFVAQKITAVDLPLSVTGYASRAPQEILASGYATPEDKCVLLLALASGAELEMKPALTGAHVPTTNRALVLPSLFTKVLVLASTGKKNIWLDPSEPVTPFGVIEVDLRGKPAFLPYPQSDARFFEDVTIALPFSAFQRVGVDAKLGESGNLTAKVKYTMRGDNELLLRVAFYQTPKEKWKDVAGLLAISDGFRGQVTSVNASDPTATKEPFTVEYEISQPKFVDWSKKPVRIPALLPQISLPDPPAKAAAGGKAPNIELGTPLDVETRMTLRLPAGTTVQAPAGTAVDRDYATFASKYGASQNSVTAFRHVNFLMCQIPADRAMDYKAFLHAVQNDQAQGFTLDREGAGGEDGKPAKPAAKP
jgi:hypothetical protein